MLGQRGWLRPFRFCIVFFFIRLYVTGFNPTQFCLPMWNSDLDLKSLDVSLIHSDSWVHKSIQNRLHRVLITEQMMVSKKCTVWNVFLKFKHYHNSLTISLYLFFTLLWTMRLTRRWAFLWSFPPPGGAFFTKCKNETAKNLGAKERALGYFLFVLQGNMGRGFSFRICNYIIRLNGSNCVGSHWSNDIGKWEYWAGWQRHTPYLEKKLMMVSVSQLR